jgi:hypothetical protein
MKVPLTTLAQVAKDTTNTKAVFCTNEKDIPSCLLFHKDLVVLAAELARTEAHPILVENPTARTLAQLLAHEAEEGSDSLATAVLSSKAFARITKTPMTAELQFPIRQRFHFLLCW